MLDCLIDDAADALPIHTVAEGGLDAWLGDQRDGVKAWVAAHRFKPADGASLLLPGPDGRPAGVLLGLGAKPDLWSFGGLAAALPDGAYRFVALAEALSGAAATGWALGAYEFRRYRAKPRERRPARLVWPAGADRARAARVIRAAGLVRDLINTPAQDLGPAELSAAASDLAQRHGARHREIAGDDLLVHNYPLIHAVGRAATRPPRLIELVWGDPADPKVTLVGKGVVFDSGGLDIKGASGMALMKKDMGGAATVLGLADMVMDAGLKLRLRVLVPAVENAIAGNAFHPGDVFTSRAGLTVEIGNTDAEGRLILADALADGDAEAPELMIDCATLTGAARVALGPDLPALFCDDDATAEAILASGRAQSDPLWRLPLHAPYRAMIDSKLADLNNSGEDGMAGSITAALFLKDFVKQAKVWAHIDLYAWNGKPRPGRPPGGEMMVARGLYALLADRYG
jgi:leucyl aminopeptidase